MRLLLVRHGEVAPSRTFYGHLDVALSERGLQQAVEAGDALAGLSIDAVYSSDLSRATRGAELIAAHHDVAHQVNAAFREMHLGTLEGIAFDDARASHPELASKRYEDMIDDAFPGGETIRTVSERVVPALDALAEQHASHTVALVAHNTVNRIVLGAALGLPLERIFGFRQDFGCINRIDYRDGRPVVRLLNWTPGGLAAGL